MWQLRDDTHLILDGEVRVYRRERSKRWQAAFMIDGHTIRIRTSKRPQHNPLFGFPLVMCFQKLPVFMLLGDCSVGFQALFFDFGRTYPVGSGFGRP